MEPPRKVAHKTPLTARSAPAAATATMADDGTNNKGLKSTSIFYFRMNEGAKHAGGAYRTVIAASTSSVLSTFAAFPLDFAKSRMQSYKTTFTATVALIIGTIHFRRGVLPPLISVTVVRSILLVTAVLFA